MLRIYANWHPWLLTWISEGALNTRLQKGNVTLGASFVWALIGVWSDDRVYN